LPPSSELRREVVVEPLPRGGIVVDIEANTSEREALARRFDLLEVGSLRGQGRLVRLTAGEIGLEGWLDAAVVQTCVISLEPVPAEVHVPVRRRYRRDVAGRTSPADDQLAADDELEPLAGDRIDVGEAFAEELGLALEPYPHAEGAADEVAKELGPEVSFSPAGSDDAGPRAAAEESLAR
jgi:uncharacterized metal-binding protein YceD (DUF177 family)